MKYSVILMSWGNMKSVCWTRKTMNFCFYMGFIVLSMKPGQSCRFKSWVSSLLMKMALVCDREARDSGLPQVSSLPLASTGILCTVERTFWAQQQLSDRRLLCTLTGKGGRPWFHFLFPAGVCACLLGGTNLLRGRPEETCMLSHCCVLGFAYW